MVEKKQALLPCFSLSYNDLRPALYKGYLLAHNIPSPVKEIHSHDFFVSE